MWRHVYRLCGGQLVATEFFAIAYLCNGNTVFSCGLAIHNIAFLFLREPSLRLLSFFADKLERLAGK